MTSDRFPHMIRGPRTCSSGVLHAAPLLLGLLFILSSCARPPYSTESLSTGPLLTSRDGRLRYGVPTGWFDATSHAKSSRSAVWLVRNDYRASIAVNTIDIDEETRREVKRNGLLRVGQLSMQLNTNVRSAVIVQPPKVDRTNGREYCVYEIDEPATRDRIRVALVDTGDSVYEVTALQTGGDRPGTSQEVFSVQDLFLARLKW